MRRRLFSVALLATAAYLAGRRDGLVDGEVRGTLHASRTFLEAVAGAAPRGA